MLNSVKDGWDGEVVFKRPQDLPAWCKQNMPEWGELVYHGSEKHPQTSYQRARFSGLTGADVLMGEQKFKDLYGMDKKSSALADQAFNCIRNGIQHNHRWDASLSVVPELHMHYHLDGGNRNYALLAQNGDVKLLTAVHEFS